MSPQTISITEEWELLAHEVKVDIDPMRRADIFCNLCTWRTWVCNQVLMKSEMNITDTMYIVCNFP